MWVILWAILALAAGLFFMALNARRLARRGPPLVLAPGEQLGLTALQRLAVQSLVVAVVFLGVAIGLILWAGPAGFYDRASIRVPVTLMLLASLLTLAAFTLRAALLMRRVDAAIDERDRAILERAAAIEGTPMLVTAALWTVGLQQTFWGDGAVPLVYLYLVFWSLIMVKALAMPIGVLLGYRRA